MRPFHSPALTKAAHHTNRQLPLDKDDGRAHWAVVVIHEFGHTAFFKFLIGDVSVDLRGGSGWSWFVQFLTVPVISITMAVSSQDRSANDLRSSLRGSVSRRLLLPKRSSWQVVAFTVLFSLQVCKLDSSHASLRQNAQEPFCDLCVERPQLHRREAEDGARAVQVRHVRYLSGF